MISNWAESQLTFNLENNKLWMNRSSSGATYQWFHLQII